MKKVLPNWANRHLNYQGMYRTFESKPDPRRTTPTQTKVREGRAVSKKLRNTCLKCNNGWMHAIEDEAKPSLEKLIRNESIVLDQEAQQKLASLISLVTIRAEFLDRKFGSTKSEKDFLREHGVPPPNWRIWIARFIGSAPGDYWYNRFALRLGPKKELETFLSASEFKSNVLPTYNTQSSTFVWGQFCCTVVSSTYLTEFKGYDGKLPRIWPFCVPIIDSKLLPMLTDQGAATLGDAVGKFFYNN
jgi:hypothetical protein